MRGEPLLDGAPPPPRRGLFGYRKRAVEEYVAHREALLRERDQRIHEAEARAADLHVNLAQREQAIDQLKQEIDSVGTDPRESSHEYAARLTATFMTEELQKVLGAAQLAATRIIERADLTTQERLNEAEQLWREVEAQVSALASWEHAVRPASDSARGTIASAQARIDEVPERIRDALTPMADAIAHVQAQIAELARLASPPSLSKPEKLDEVSREGDDSVEGSLTDLPAGEGHDRANDDAEPELDEQPGSSGMGTEPTSREAIGGQAAAREGADRPPGVAETGVPPAGAIPPAPPSPIDTDEQEPEPPDFGADDARSSARRARRWLGAAGLVLLVFLPRG